MAKAPVRTIRAKTTQPDAEAQAALEGAIKAGAAVVRTDVPSYYVASIQAAITGSDINLVFSRPHPVQVNGTQAVAAEAVASINMSAGTAKDLMLVLQDQVASLEAKHGTINTDFTARRAAVKPAGGRPRKLNG